MAEKSEKISEGNASWEDLSKLMHSGMKEHDHYRALLNSAGEMMLIYKAYKEAGFNDEQAFKVVLTILAATIGGRK